MIRTGKSTYMAHAMTVALGQINSQRPMDRNWTHHPREPEGGPSLDQGSVLPDSVASGKDIGSLTRNCLHPVPKGRILKHIPKAARPGVSRLLAMIINRILADPTSVHQWQCLLSFAAVVLEQPMRGGRRHNLTATIKKRAESYFNDWPDNGALVL